MAHTLSKFGKMDGENENEFWGSNAIEIKRNTEK